MKLSAKTQALYDLIAPAVAVCDVELWGIEFTPQGKRSLLRIYIDKPDVAPTIDELDAAVLNTASAEDSPTDDDAVVDEEGRGAGVPNRVRVTHPVRRVPA